MTIWVGKDAMVVEIVTGMIGVVCVSIGTV